MYPSETKGSCAIPGRAQTGFWGALTVSAVSVTSLRFCSPTMHCSRWLLLSKRLPWSWRCFSWYSEPWRYKRPVGSRDFLKQSYEISRYKTRMIVTFTQVKTCTKKITYRVGCLQHLSSHPGPASGISLMTNCSSTSRHNFLPSLLALWVWLSLTCEITYAIIWQVQSGEIYQHIKTLRGEKNMSGYIFVWNFQKIKMWIILRWCLQYIIPDNGKAQAK